MYMGKMKNMRRRWLKIFCEVNFFISFVCCIQHHFVIVLMPLHMAFWRPSKNARTQNLTAFLLFRVALFFTLFSIHSYKILCMQTISAAVTIFSWNVLFFFCRFLAQNASINRSYVVQHASRNLCMWNA